MSYWLYTGIKKINHEKEEINIEFKIFLEKETYATNESINLSAYIKNIGNRATVIPEPIYLRNVRLILTLGNGTSITPRSAYNPPAANNISLKPNEIIEMTPSIIDISGGVMCEWVGLGEKLPAGTYCIKAEYGIPSFFGTPVENIKQYNSNLLMFEVIEE